MHVANYIGLVHSSEKDLSRAFNLVAKHHGDEPDIYQVCTKMAGWSDEHLTRLKYFMKRYSSVRSKEPDQLKKILFDKPRSGGLALVRDLHDLWLLANEVNLCWIVIWQAAKLLRDKELEDACKQLSQQTQQQIAWLITRIKQAAPQALVVAE